MHCVILFSQERQERTREDQELVRQKLQDASSAHWAAQINDAEKMRCMLSYHCVFLLPMALTSLECEHIQYNPLPDLRERNRQHTRPPPLSDINTHLRACRREQEIERERQEHEREERQKLSNTDRETYKAFISATKDEMLKLTTKVTMKELGQSSLYLRSLSESLTLSGPL